MILTNLLESDIGLISDSALCTDIVTNPLYIQKLIAEEGGVVLGLSFLRITSEITIELKTANKLTAQKVIKKLLEEQTIAAKKLGINQTHAWTNSIEANTMKHYGFKERDERSFILHF